MQKKQTLGSMLLEYGLATEQDLDQALDVQADTGKRLGEILVEMEKVSQSDIDWIISKQMDLPFIIVDEKTIDRDLLAHFPKDFLILNRIIPMFENDDVIAIATDDPFNTAAFEEIESLRNRKVTLSAASGESLDEILARIYRDESMPELVSQIEGVLTKIDGSCFYRMDFILRQTGTTINAFGFGMLKTVLDTELVYSVDDIFKAFGNLDVPFLYDTKRGAMETFLSVIPVTRQVETETFPLVLGSYGLAVPEDTAFVDMNVHGIEGLYHSSRPVPGYRFYSMHPGEVRADYVVYTVDSAPLDFMNSFVSMRIPRQHQACEGVGCSDCKYIGLVFTELQGTYSYTDIISFYKEG